MHFGCERWTTNAQASNLIRDIKLVGHELGCTIQGLARLFAKSVSAMTDFLDCFMFWPHVLLVFCHSFEQAAIADSSGHRVSL